MSVVLHKAIKDAIRDSPGYNEKAILVSHVLEATTDIAGRETDLYSAVHRLFSVMPTRLVRRSMFLIRTQDVPDGVELGWDSREEPRAGYSRTGGLLGPYEPDEPVALALRDLERVCHLRAGHVRTSYEEISNSSSFPRQPYLHRRVVAYLPLSPAAAAARAQRAATETLTHGELAVAPAPPKRERDTSERAFWPAPRVPVAASRRRSR